jgi:predicted O-linked N-acetylglucosamine transferase (SPINDLY family)
MGVPVVTRVGTTVVGRAGWSQLNNLNLPELAAFDDAQFVHKAVELADNLPALSKLRAGLRERMLGSPLMDGAAFAAAMESVYRRVLGLS